MNSRVTVLTAAMVPPLVMVVLTSAQMAPEVLVSVPVLMAMFWPSMPCSVPCVCR